MAKETMTKSLMIKPASVSLLPHLQSRAGAGKHGKFFKKLAVAIDEWPKDQIMTIPSTEMRANKKERAAFLVALNKFLITSAINWRARWSSMEQVVYLHRQEMNGNGKHRK